MYKNDLLLVKDSWAQINIFNVEICKNIFVHLKYEILQIVVEIEKLSHGINANTAATEYFI